jgi:hypothetical protein
LKKGKLDEYLAAIGLVAHYVGDACQPLHISHLHHGRTEAESRVHSVYETNMVDRFAVDLVDRVNARKLPSLANVNNGFEAARAVIELMRRTVKRLPPEEVLDAFNEATGRERLAIMWTRLGDRTADCMADGARTLLMLWESAWQVGNGDQLPKSSLKAIDTGRLAALYNNKTFAVSEYLPALAALLRRPVPATSTKLSAKVEAATTSKKKAAHKSTSTRSSARR